MVSAEMFRHTPPINSGHATTRFGSVTTVPPLIRSRAALHRNRGMCGSRSAFRRKWVPKIQRSNAWYSVSRYSLLSVRLTVPIGKSGDTRFAIISFHLRDLAALHECLNDRHSDDTPVQMEPSEDVGNGIKVTCTRGSLSHLGQLIICDSAATASFGSTIGRTPEGGPRSRSSPILTDPWRSRPFTRLFWQRLRPLRRC